MEPAEFVATDRACSPFFDQYGILIMVAYLPHVSQPGRAYSRDLTQSQQSSLQGINVLVTIFRLKCQSSAQEPLKAWGYYLLGIKSRRFGVDHPAFHRQSLSHDQRIEECTDSKHIGFLDEF